MNDTVESKECQFFFSQFKCIRTITVSEKRKIEQIFYEPRQMPCVLKTYYSRDLSEVYQKLKAIRHENLAVIYDILFCDGNTYVIEENIDGETLAEHLKNYGPFPEKDVIAIVEKVCKALEKLHCQTPPLIHRDIKPSNIMLREDGTVKLIDFDTARYHKESGECDTILLGTKEYASPEHYGYGQTDITSDIYSIGAMMNELLTGEVLVNHKATYKGRLLPLINRCIQVDSDKRFQSVRELRRVLVSYQKPWGILIRNKKKIVSCVVAAMVVAMLLSSFVAEKIQWPDLEQAYQEEISPKILLENKNVDTKLKKLLGTKYDYVMECLYSIDMDVRYADGIYFMQGGMPGLYTFMEAAVSLTDDGEIECGFLQDGICYYYASDDEFYDSPSYNMMKWLSSYENYTIQFHQESGEDGTGDISGSYVREDSSAYITLQETEDGQYSVKGFASWGTNTGEIEGSLEQINSQQFLYVEFPDEEFRAEMKIIAYDGRLFVETLQGMFGGLNVSFDGTYKKQ